MTIVMQKNDPGRYVSDLINDRYQVMQSSGISSIFFVYDHAKEDNIRERNGNMLHFDSADAAMKYITNPTASVKQKQTQKEKVVTTNTRKARASTREVDVRERKERKGSMLSVIRSLIRKGGTDEEVFAELKALHPEATYGVKTVGILRKEMGL